MFGYDVTKLQDGAAQLETKTVDNRREKRYGRVLLFSVRRRAILWGGGFNANYPNTNEFLKNAVVAELETEPDEIDARLRVDWSREDDVRYFSGKKVAKRFTVEFFIRSDKPSETLSVEEAVEKLTGLPSEEGIDRIIQIQRNALADLVRKRRAVDNAKRKSDQANQALELVNAEVRKRAKKIVRFEQRYAALLAELEAEIKAQSNEIADEIEPGKFFASDWDTDAIAAVRNKVEEQDLSPSVGRLRSQSSEFSTEDFLTK